MSDSDSVTVPVEEYFTTKNTDYEYECVNCTHRTTVTERPLKVLRAAECPVCEEVTTQWVLHTEMIDAVNKAAAWLADAGLLTEKQAFAYVCGEVLDEPIDGISEMLGTSESNAENLYYTARNKVADAREFFDRLDTLENNT